MSFLKNAAALAAAAGLVYAGLLWARKKLDDSLVAEQAEQAEVIPPEEAPEACAAGAAAEDAPNRNPVDAAPAGPVTDPTKIASPEDFQDWEHLGCQG